LHRLLLVPSFYGLAGWIIAVLLYFLNAINWAPPTALCLVTCISVVASFALSLSLNYKRFAAIENRPVAANASWQWRRRLLEPLCFVYLAIGTLGLVWYIATLATRFGNLYELALVFISESHRIRWANEEGRHVSFQLTYFGWIGIFLAVYGRKHFRFNKLLLAMSTLQFIGNLLFVDRTRPIWLLFVTTQMIIYGATFSASGGSLLQGGLLVRRGRRAKRSINAILLPSSLIGLSMLIFYLVAEWSGKTGENMSHSYGNPNVPEIVLGPYIYATSGLAFLNDQLSETEPWLGFNNSIYPALVAASKIDPNIAAPRALLDFRLCPHPTNVGTFLEPFLSDGGIAFAIVGIAIHAFFFDWLAYRCLAQRGFHGIHLWATLCFVNAISCFVSKVNTTPVWIFSTLGIVSIALGASARHGRCRLVTAQLPDAFSESKP